MRNRKSQLLLSYICQPSTLLVLKTQIETEYSNLKTPAAIMIKIIFVPHKLNYHYTYNTTNSIYLAICFLLLSSPLPKFTTAQYEDPSSDATRGIRSNWNASPPPHPLTGVIFIAFTGVIILVMILYYYFREGCLQRSVEISRGAAAGIRFSLRNPSQQGRRGLDPDVIKSFPVFHYSEVKDLKEVMKKGPLECAVCLSAFEDDETLRLLPKCDHVFHPQCVDVWLESHTTCPYCRADLVPDDNKSNHVSVIVAEYETNTAGGSFDCSCSRSRGGATSGSDDVTLQVEEGGAAAAAVVGRSSTAIPTGDEDAAATAVNNGSAATDQANNNHNNRSIIDQCRRLGSFGKLSRWNSTGHADSERFTLRLPTEFESRLGSSGGKHQPTIQDQEMVSLHRTRSCIVLPSTRECTDGPVGQYSGGGFCSDLIWVKTYIDQKKGTGV